MRSKLASILADQGNLSEAAQILREETIPLFTSIGNAHGRAVSLNHLASILVEQGNLDEALKIQLEDVLPTFIRIKDPRECAITRYNAALVLLTRSRPGDRDKAKELLAKALPDAITLRIPEASAIFDSCVEHGVDLSPVNLSPLLSMIPGKAVGLDAAVRIPSASLHASNTRRIGRNSMCPCGSGMKYKKCHGSQSG